MRIRETLRKATKGRKNQTNKKTMQEEREKKEGNEERNTLRK